MVIDGADLQVDTLAAAEGPLGDGQPFVGSHRSARYPFPQAPRWCESHRSRRGQPPDRYAPAGAGRRRTPPRSPADKMLADFVAVKDLPHPQGDAVFSLQATFGDVASPGQSSPTRTSVASSSCWRVRARWSANRGLRQTISRSPGVIGALDLSQVAFVKEGQLQRTGFKQFADLRASQRRDPAQAGQRLQLLPNPGFA